MVLLNGASYNVDYVYTISSKIVQTEDSSSYLDYDLQTITRFSLDEDESNLQSGEITKFVWNEGFVCRLVVNKFALLTELNDKSKTLRLYSNQFSFTRAIQTILNTKSCLLDIEYYNNEIWFLYNSLNVQHFNLCSMKWSGSHDLKMYSIQLE